MLGLTSPLWNSSGGGGGGMDSSRRLHVGESPTGVAGGASYRGGDSTEATLQCAWSTPSPPIQKRRDTSRHLHMGDIPMWVGEGLAIGVGTVVRAHLTTLVMLKRVLVPVTVSTCM